MVSRIWQTVLRNWLGLAAFLIPLGVRAIPEVLAGPYQVGWDTIAFYVPNTLDWAAGRLGWVQLLGTAPLMYMISVPVYWLLRINPVWIFKVMGPILYGSMIYALFRFLQLGLKWTDRMALGGALMTSLYFVTLRVSWDLYRNMLGLTFVLLSLPLLTNHRDLRSQVILALLVILAVASDQLTGVIALSLIGARTLMALVRRERVQVTQLLRVGIPGLALFLSIVYAGIVVTGIGLVQQQPLVPSRDVFGSSIGFLAYIYLPLTPLVILGIRRVGNFDVKTWIIVLSGLALTALIPFAGLIVMSYRWSLLLDIPVCIYASAGLARILRAKRPTLNLTTLFAKRILVASALLLIVSSSLYIAVPAQSAMSYYVAFPGFLPTSMVQDTVPLSDMPSLRTMLDWVHVNMKPGTALITHQAIYGWARAYLPSTDSIVNYGYSSPQDGVSMASKAGYASVLMIWWVNGSGWHGQPNVPSGFSPVASNGSIVVYDYY